MSIKEDLQKLITGQPSRRKSRGKSADLNLHVKCECTHEQIQHLGDLGPCQVKECTCEAFKQLFELS